MIGAGRVEVSDFAGGGNAGEVSVPVGGMFTPELLEIGGASRLDLDRDALVGSVNLVEATGSGGRFGDGLLTVGGPSESLLADAQVGGAGVTVFNGPLLMETASGSTRFVDSALLRTNAATNFKEGGLDLGTATVWENAGTLTIAKQTSAQFLGSGSVQNARHRRARRVTGHAQRGRELQPGRRRNAAH